MSCIKLYFQGTAFSTPAENACEHIYCLKLKTKLWLSDLLLCKIPLAHKTMLCGKRFNCTNSYQTKGIHGGLGLLPGLWIDGGLGLLPGFQKSYLFLLPKPAYRLTFISPILNYFVNFSQTHLFVKKNLVKKDPNLEDLWLKSSCHIGEHIQGRR